jgi:UDP-N-acetylmuramate dehydrogenase
MEIKENYSLKDFNTFGIECQVEKYLRIDTLNDLELLSQDIQYFILGSGSNILFTKDVKGTILHNNLKGIKIVEENEDYVLVKSASGEIWHRLVLWAIENNFAGIENLSLIPGTVGAAPIQNIGAYGVELKDVFYCLEAFEFNNRKIKTFHKEDCEFGYRESAFKRKYAGQFFISSVTLKLSKKPVFQITYGDIKKTLVDNNINIQNISKAVVEIRQSKLPDPNVIGNAGSFFKNPTISTEHFNKLITIYPEIPSYPLNEHSIKIPAGWLIEKAGWKGKKIGNAGVHEKQALVLINLGKAKGNEIVELSKKIQKDIYQKFGISLEAEVNIW